MGLPGYDAWKTREPEAYWETCDHCGGVLRRDTNWNWYCERCDDEEEEINAMIDGEPITLEDLDAMAPP